MYRRAAMQKCDFDKVAIQISWNHNSAWVFSILEEHLLEPTSGFT